MDSGEICCGQVAGLITEVNGAGAVVNDIVKNLGARFEELKQKSVDFFGSSPN